MGRKAKLAQVSCCQCGVTFSRLGGHRLRCDICLAAYRASRRSILPKEDILTQSKLKEMFSYDPDTGEFTRLIALSNSVKVGERAGHRNKLGYFTIRIGRANYLCHRLAWLYMTGEWPTLYIDHKDRDPSNNRFDNLRHASQSQNMANSRVRSDNRTGLKGVLRYHNRWHAYIRVSSRRVFIGSFKTPEEASAAYFEAARDRSGEFARG